VEHGATASGGRRERPLMSMSVGLQAVLDILGAVKSSSVGMVGAMDF